MTFALMLALPAMALADLVTVSDANTLQASGDTTKQVGQTGSARFHLLSTGNNDPNDPINNCNANASNKVKVTVTSTAVDKDGNALATSPVTFNSPGFVELSACDDTGTTATIEGAQSLGYAVGSSAQVGDVITVNAAASGGRTTSGGSVTGAFSYDTFKITVVAPPEQGTALSVSPASGTYGGTTSLSATLSSNSTGVANKSVDFTLNGQSVGSATTNSSGVATLSGVSLSGIDAGTHADAVGASYAGTGSGCTTNCYGPSEGTATLTVDAKPITGSFTADNKVYDGNNSATVLSRSVDQTAVVGTDEVTLDGGTATFNDENAANGKTVTLAGATLGGADASNYSLTSVSTTTANITPLGITGSFTADNKEYDGTTAATVLTRSLNGVLSPGGTPDAVSLSGGTATFDNRNVANGKTVTLTGASLTGNDSGNYSLTSVSTTTANITAKALTITGLTAENKVFDNTTNATINGTPGLNGVVVINNVADDVSLTGTATGTFVDKLVGNDKDVNVTGLTLSGADAGNYSLTELVLSADILAWTSKGFYQPVDMNGVYNTVKGGSTVPLKFELFAGATELTATSSVTSLQSQKIACDGTNPEDAIEATATGGTSLRYDTTGGQFIYNWKTPTGAGSCYKVTLTAQDGTTMTAFFKMK
jgi:hypothetical protein